MGQLVIHGKVKQGLRIASGLNPDPTLKLNNTIELQKPFFIERGVPRMREVYNGTVNLDIAPQLFKIEKPDYEVTCEWHPGVVETFWLVDAHVRHKNKTYPAYIYYPCPSPVKSHRDDTIELLVCKISDLQYGDPVSVTLIEGKVHLL